MKNQKSGCFPAINPRKCPHRLDVTFPRKAICRIETLSAQFGNPGGQTCIMITQDFVNCTHQGTQSILREIAKPNVTVYAIINGLNNGATVRRTLRCLFFANI